MDLSTTVEMTVAFIEVFLLRCHSERSEESQPMEYSPKYKRFFIAFRMTITLQYRLSDPDQFG